MNAPDAFNNRILLVDDNTAIHEDFRKIFKITGKEANPLQAARQLLFGASKSVAVEPRYTLDSAYQGAEALEMVYRANEAGMPYALAFVDVRMPPGMDGIETIKSIWKESPELQIAICTAYSDYSWNDMLTSLGSTDNMLIVKKPFDNIEVRQIASALTAKWNLNREHLRERSALENMKRQYEAILNSVGDGIHHIDSDGNIIYVNPSATRMFGWSAEDLMGRHAHAAIHHTKPDGSPYPVAECPIYQSAKDGKTRHVPDEMFFRRDGTPFHVELTCTAVFDPTGEPSGGTVVFKDISERRKDEAEMLRLNSELQEKNELLSEDIQRREQAEIALINARRIAEEANNSKSTFLANMSHEIRTPMNGIIGMIFLMKQTSLSLKQNEYATKIDSAAHGLLGIINDILDFSKVEAGKITFEKIEFNLDEVLSRLVQLTSLQAQKKGLELKINVAENPPKKLIGDPLRLGQILLNLVSNALKFTQAGIVEVSVRPIKSNSRSEIALQFDIRDTGIGIAAEHIHRLFEPFSQSDSTTTRRYGGTGLGLAIAKRFINLMGGDIDVQSTLGEGSTFTFTVIFGKITGDSARSSMIYTLPAGRRVLVIDANEASRTETCLLLRELSYEPVAAESCASGAQALRELSDSGARGCDLALMDCSGPGMNWTQDAARLSMECGAMEVPPIILIASKDMGEQHIHVEGAGYDSVLVKPVTRSSLFEAIMGASSRKSGQRKISIQTEMDPALEGARILLVEDNEHNQEIATEVLKLAGCEVSVAAEGSEALAVLATFPPEWFSLVLTDIQMPGMDGYETARAIRSDNRFARVPIIAMTADAISGTREKCMAVGMNDYLTKPINPPDVYATLTHWIKLREKQEPLPTQSKRPSALAIEIRKTRPVSLRPTFELSLLDVGAGVGRVGGNRHLYDRLLTQFQSKYANTADEVAKALEAHDSGTAMRLLHNFKGFAGNLGAQKLMRASQEWEQCFKDGSVADNESLVRTNFRTVLADTLRVVGEILDANESRPAAPVRTPAVQVGESGSSRGLTSGAIDFLKQLERALENNDMEAETFVVQLTEILQDISMRNELKTLRDHVQRFNFPEALTVLKKLETQLASAH